MPDRTCEECGAWFTPKRSKQILCSVACASARASRRNAERATVRPPRRRIAHNGYVQIRIAGDYVYEHRYVMEQALGRPLESSEVVHHINHDKLDNRPENLTLTSHSEHMKAHHAEPGFTRRGPRPEAELPLVPCPVCGEMFKPYKRDRDNRVRACSWSCSNRLRPRGVAEGRWTEHVQDEKARLLWADGAGAFHWRSCL